MHRLNCFEIFGFDVLLDSDLKPWLIEVNLSPSLSPDSPLDFTIKQNLLINTWNLCGIKRFDRGSSPRLIGMVGLHTNLKNCIYFLNYKITIKS